MNPPFLKLAMPLPDGTIHAMELDEPAAREFLAMMEEWGDYCSQDSIEMRDALRSHFNGENDKVRRDDLIRRLYVVASTALFSIFSSK